MIPKSENSLPLSAGDESKHESQFAHGKSVSPSSSKSNPFEVSGIEDEIQLEDFSYIHAQLPKASPTPKEFVKEHLSRPIIYGSDKIKTRQRSASLDEDKAVSEWETVAPDEEFEENLQVPPRQLRHRKNFELVFHAQDILESSRKVNSSKPGRNTILLPPRPNTKASAFIERNHSFSSVSSAYSDIDQAFVDGCEALHPQPSLEGHGQHSGNGVGRDCNNEFVATCSRASSSTSGDPFKYDGDIYSGFLHPSAERDISDALHHAGVSSHTIGPAAQSIEMKDPRRGANEGRGNVDEEIKIPVAPGTKKEAVQLEPPSQASNRVGNLLPRRPQNGNEGDWQTVMTDEPFGSMQGEFKDTLAKGTGSSLADVSDAFEGDYYLHEHESTDRIIQHPHQGSDPVSYHVRNDKRTAAPIFMPKSKGDGSGGFPKNSLRDFKQSPSRADDAIRRFSNVFTREAFSPRCQKQSNLAGIGSRLDTYQFLSSDLDLPRGGAGDITPTPAARQERNGRFRWSRIRENLGRDPPKTPLTIFDQPLYRRGIMGKFGSQKSSHVPHDEFLAKIPRLPFPLISLPEAAMLQYFRRERGEEDHTDPSISFAVRGRSGTASSISTTNFPQTPPSGRFSVPPISPRECLPRPVPAHLREGSKEVLQRREPSDRIADILVSSSAILATPPPSEPRAPPNLMWYGTLPRDISRLPKLRAFSSGVRNRIPPRTVGYIPTEGSLFTQSETNLIEMAREDILLRRRLMSQEDEREKVIFLGIMILTIFFPFIGLLALWGKFDSAVSWYTYGGTQTLTNDQRGTLKQQLFVEAVVYPVLIIILVVYYSVRK